jgi:hypothetical protein
MSRYTLLRKVFVLVFTLSLFLSFQSVSWGQTTGKIEGYVRDADTRKPLAGVRVSIEEARLSNVTTEDGYYFILNVPAGLRNIKAHHIGYQSAMVQGQRVYAGQNHTVDFLLKSTIIELPGEVIEGDRSPLMIKDHLVSKARATSEIITALPVDNYRDIVTLQAGVVRYGDALDPEYMISIRGGRTSQNVVYIDGIDVKRYQTSQNLLDVPEFGIEEIDVVTGGHSPEFGGVQSGVINIVTMEGSPELSGRVRFETEELNPSSSNYGYNRMQFSLGGPVPMVDDLTYFFSGDMIGKGDRRPRVAGFRGTTEDLFGVAERFSNEEEVRDFLGRDLDITEMLRTARSHNINLPVLNLTDLRRERFGGTDFEGRLPGNQGDEYRIQGKFTFHPADGIKLTGAYFEDRDQGIIFDRRRIFWTEERNQGYLNRNQLGIISYNQTLRKSPKRNLNISFRGSYQRFESHRGDLFAPFDTTAVTEMGLTPGASLGYHDQRTVGNFMFQDIPIFGQDVWPTIWEQYQFIDVDQAHGSRADNPFGLGWVFYDQNEGFTNFIANSREDRADFRLDFDGQFSRHHRVRTGLEVKAWQLNNFSGRFTTSHSVDYWYVRPDMESFYLEDRIEYQRLVADIGLRMDSFFAGTDYPSIPSDQYRSERIKPSRKTVVAPRFGVTQPVTEHIQVRGSYKINYQIPQFSHLYDAINVNWYLQSSIPFFFGNPELDFRKATSFELGLTTLLSKDWIIDLTGYKTIFENNIAARYDQEARPGRILKIFQNDDSGAANGVDVSLKKRLSDNFSVDIAYSLLFSKSTGSFADDFLQNEGRYVWSGDPPLPPEEFSPNDFDQTHTINALLNLRFPKDFRRGTVTGKILKDSGFFVTIQVHSGRPYTKQEPIEFEFIEENNASRTDWQSMVNLRVMRDFTLWGLDYTAFVDIRNLLDTDNLSVNQVDALGGYAPGITNGIYQTTGSTFTDGLTVSDALDYLRIATPEEYIDPSQREPTDIDGDGDRDEADRAEIVRRLDMNGDGQVTVEEELAMAILAFGAFDANPENFDIPRLVRFGLEVQF